jgi:hypothetical protein
VKNPPFPVLEMFTIFAICAFPQEAMLVWGKSAYLISWLPLLPIDFNERRSASENDELSHGVERPR